MCSSLPKAFSDRWRLGWGGVEGHPGGQGGPKRPKRDSLGKEDHPQPFVLCSMCEWQELENAEHRGRDVGLILIRDGKQEN